MNIPITQFFNYLFKPNTNVNINYREERYSGDITVTEFLSGDIEDTLEVRNSTAYNNFINDINNQVRDQLRQSNLYRFMAIIGLLFAVLGLSMILYFASGNSWVILGGAYYSFFAYLLVEAYIQANRNFFEDQLYKRLMKNYLKV